MTIFRRRSRADLERMRAEITRMSAVLHEHEQRAASVEQSVAETARAPAPAPPEQAGDSEVIRRLDELAAQVSALDARVTSVSRELANQVTELGNDIETLQQRPDGATVDPEQLGELHDAQTRLASEQARYQIAFRADLAKLAEELRKPRRG